MGETQKGKFSIEITNKVSFKETIFSNVLQYCRNLKLKDKHVENEKNS